MAEVKRKRSESFESMLRRFQERIRSSGKILQAKKVRFYRSPVNRTQRRKSALERGRRTALREFLIKAGKLKEDKTKKRR